MTIMEKGALPFDYWVVQNDQAELVEGGVIEETMVSIFVNGQDLATVMCSPLDQEALALGFLYNEGVIDGIGAVELIRPNVNRTTVDIFLKQADYSPPRRLVLTSGCGGGVTLQDLMAFYPPLESDFCTTTDVVIARMQDLQGEAQLYNTVRGVHTSILTDETTVLVSAEDVGRHNTIDKVSGKALFDGIETRDRLVLTSGRISSEMLGKARRMGVPVVASRTAPTSITLSLAEAWNICVAGYVRRGSLRVYTHPERLGLNSHPR